MLKIGHTDLIKVKFCTLGFQGQVPLPFFGVGKCVDPFVSNSSIGIYSYSSPFPFLKGFILQEFGYNGDYLHPRPINS